MKLNNPFHFDFSDAVVLKEKLCPILVRNVNTEDAGAFATVTATQEDDKVFLDFGIPRGFDGSTVMAAEEALSTYYSDGIYDDLSGPQSTVKKITVTNENGNNVFYAQATPGVYRKVPVCINCYSHDVTMKVNCVYRYSPTSVGDHLKLTPDLEERYVLRKGRNHFNNRWRILFFTGLPGEYASGDYTYVGYLHLPDYVEVPNGWAGEPSALYESYQQYRLKENTFHDVTIEEVGGHYYLSCNVDYAMPLIVTGSPKCNSIMMGGTNFAMYQIQALSHTSADIYAAFHEGRDVYIRLENPMMSIFLGTSKTLPDIKNVEARVVSVQKDVMYPNGYAVAYGMGFTTQNGQLYTVNITLDNNTATITVYLFKAYEDNTTAIYAEVDKRIANNNTTVYAEIDTRIENYINEALGGDY
ncbi:MAG: hypothetical protein IJD10_02480 [Clostridia bacterium]|nr:hypothetical protein [Clostridia bacterium]